MAAHNVAVKKSHSWWIVAAMAIVMLPISMDRFGLVVALPSIGSRFSAGTSELAWVLNITFVFFGAGAMVLGRLCDIAGRRRLLLVSMAVLALSSVGCAAAPDILALLVFRALQGVGMSGVYAASFPIVNTAFAPERRSRGLGMWTAGFLLGNVIGAPLTGWLSDSLSWRWLFWANLPLLGVALVMILLVVPESRDPTAPRHVSGTSVVAPTVGFLLLIAAVQSGNERG